MLFKPRVMRVSVTGMRGSAVWAGILPGIGAEQVASAAGAEGGQS